MWDFIRGQQFVLIWQTKRDTVRAPTSLGITSLSRFTLAIKSMHTYLLRTPNHCYSNNHYTDSNIQL